MKNKNFKMFGIGALMATYMGIAFAITGLSSWTSVLTYIGMFMFSFGFLSIICVFTWYEPEFDDEWTKYQDKYKEQFFDLWSDSVRQSNEIDEKLRQYAFRIEELNKKTEEQIEKEKNNNDKTRM